MPNHKWKLITLGVTAALISHATFAETTPAVAADTAPVASPTAPTTPAAKPANAATADTPAAAPPASATTEPPKIAPAVNAAADKPAKPEPAPILKQKPSCPQPAKLKEGWYIGGQAGYESFRVRNTVATPASSTLSANPVISANGWLAGLILGYGEMYNDWLYWGLEIFANANNFSQGLTINDGIIYNNQYNTSSAIGIGFLPGVKFTDSAIAYARLGWSRAIMQTEETLTATTAASRSNDSQQFMFGVGIETLIMYQWSLRTEFNHLYYNSYNTPMPYGTKVSPSDNQFMMALIYHIQS